MDYRLTSEQRMLQESMQRMVEREIRPVLKSHDPDKPLPKAAMRGLLQVCATQGMTGGRVPEKAGGAGLSALTLGLMAEQLPPVVGIAVLAQEVTATRIHFESTPEQHERFLPGIIAGTTITCTGTTEPGTGSDPRGVITRVVDDGPDHVRITGRKMWITNASICDVINVTGSRGKDDKGLARMVRVIVDGSESPFEGREIPTLGLRQGHLGEVVFEDCRVPNRNILGKEGDAARALTLTWLANRPFLGLCAVHMAQIALEAALKYAGERQQFGRVIGGFQLVQELLADISTAITTSRLLCYYALQAIDNGERANQVSAMAKRYSLAACARAISMAMEVHGAMGISRELGLEQLYRDVRMLPIPDGTNQIMTLIEGRELTGIQAYRA
jgi:alkylation response protein AidB-like acyl-CoA dehydrogenase